jgi:UDP-N-acetylmuramate--alanine ligase
MQSEHKQVLSKEALLPWIKEEVARNANSKNGWLLITAGAGDIDALVQPIRNIIE